MRQKMKRNQCLKWIVLCCALVLLCAACGKVVVEQPPPVDETETTETGEEEAGEPATTPASNTTAKVFVCGEPSMMGFADWKNDTIYETAVSLLLDKLTEYKTTFYRYDGYDFGEADGPIVIPDSSSMKNAVREVSFYTSEGLTADGSIPSSVRRYNNDQIGSVTSVDAYVPAETLETAAAAEKFPLENAINLFDKNALNVVVSDLYELRNGSFELLTELKGYDVGILAVQSEYSGTLRGFTADGSDLVWGSPRTGAYKAHSVKSATYKKNDGSTGTYNYNVFSGYGADERAAENRTFYIIFAGNGAQVADAMNGVRAKILEKYANSTTVVPVIDVFGFYGEQSEDVTVDTAKAIEYIALEAEDIPEGGDCGFEIRADDDVPPLKVSANYPADKGTGARTYTAQDFDVAAVCTKLDGTAREIDAAPPKLTLGEGDADHITLVLTYDVDGLPEGEYILETAVSVKAAELGNDKGAFLEKWGIEIDDGSLRQLVSDYGGGGQEGVDKMRAFMVKTVGLGNLLEHTATNASANEILTVKIYFNVV
jgi:hypothetical protein